jgi:hypothetical protein
MHPIKEYTVTQEDLSLLEEVWKLVISDYLSHSGKSLPQRVPLDAILGTEQSE